MNDMLKEIYDAVLAEMADKNIEDTTENRLTFLTGLSDGWAEDESVSVEKALYQLVLSTEILELIDKLESEK